MSGHRARRRRRSLSSHELKPGVNKPAHRFDLVGLHWKGDGAVTFRTRSVKGRWSPWREAAPEEDRPDARNHELRARGWNLGSPYWTGASNRIQVRTYGHVTRVRAYYVSSPARKSRLRRTSIAGSPLILTRASWGADERIRRRRKPDYADSVRFAVVHHTAGSNSYTRAQSASIVRGIERYHVLANGWDDIGYNFLVDKYGQIFEGRWGGVDRNVVGAHAQGFNTGSSGVALIGRYDSASISPAARAALIKIIAWRLDVAHVDPQSTFSWRSTGNPKYPAGRMVTLRTISGHRDTGFTTCPGSQLYGELPSITRAVAQTGLPKLYFPKATGAPGEMVRFTGTLTQAMPWSVVVTQPDGNIVASGDGEGTTVDWTWDARTVPAGKYLYAIDAGPSVRPATGIVLGSNQTSALTALAKPALITPNGDGRNDATLVRYRLREAATVTATLVDANGVPLTTLLMEAKNAGQLQLRMGRRGDRGRPVRDRAHGQERARGRDDGHAGGHRRPHPRRLQGLAAGLLAERRRQARPDALQVHALQPGAGDPDRSPREEDRGPGVLGRAPARAAVRSSGTAASPAGSESTSSRRTSA